jgi:hypothetical protein
MPTIFGRLTVLNHEGKYVNCLCTCGNQKRSLWSNVRSGYTQSCGCLQKERTAASTTKHGLRAHPLWPIYRAMHTRCYNPQHRAYKWYGGKGIVVCERWHSIENFVIDMEACYSPGLTLDRKDSSLPYSKENCQWLTKSANSKKTHGTHQ